ncbi:MAG TPA: GNAT family protein [Rhizomicrobium sp.]
MFLETPRLYLRPVQPADAEALFAARGDAQVMRFWDWPAAASAQEVRAVIAGHLSQIAEGRTAWWVAARTPRGPAIGECDLSEIDHHHRRAEIGFLFQRAAWGQGYAREATARVLRHGFEDLALERLSARFHAGNEASRRLLEALGFSREGLLRGHVMRDGERRDCVLYGIRRAATPP